MLQGRRKELRNAPRLHMDETGWRHGAKRPWLWAQTNDVLSSFWIRPGRTKKTAVYLLGDFEGVLSRTPSTVTDASVERRRLRPRSEARRLHGLGRGGVAARSSGPRRRRAEASNHTVVASRPLPSVLGPVCSSVGP
ncbi:MAG: IS66 family transposase [Myxococcota bacterium]